MHFGGNKEAFPYCAIKSKKLGVYLSMSNLYIYLHKMYGLQYGRYGRVEDRMMIGLNWVS